MTFKLPFQFHLLLVLAAAATAVTYVERELPSDDPNITDDVITPYDVTVPEPNQSVEAPSWERQVQDSDKANVWTADRRRPVRPAAYVSIKGVWVNEGENNDGETATGDMTVAVPSTAEDDQRAGRIIDGEEAGHGDHPYLCSLQRSLYSNNVLKWQHFCGSVIYNTSTVITAAHCVENFLSEDLRVACGEHNLKQNDNTEVYRTIASVKIHEDHDGTGSRGYPNDIALLQLSDNLVFDERYVHAWKIDDGTEPVPTDCELVGWGRTEYGVMPDTPHYVNITKLDNSQCSEYWSPEQIGEGHVCLKTMGTYEGACHGDSGGPAICGDVIVGVTSWGPASCKSLTYPSVYTRLSAYIAWIKETAP